MGQNRFLVVSTFMKRSLSSSPGLDSPLSPPFQKKLCSTHQFLEETISLIKFQHSEGDENLSPNDPTNCLNPTHYWSSNKLCISVTAHSFCYSLSCLIMKIFHQIHSDGYHMGSLPIQHEIYEFLGNIFLQTDMEFSCGIISIIYIYRAYQHHSQYHTYTPFLTVDNWRSIILICCLLSSKLHDDLCVSNKDFAEIFEQESLTLAMVNNYEIMMLRLLNFNLVVTNEEYLTYAQLIIKELEVKSTGPSSSAEADASHVDSSEQQESQSSSSDQSSHIHSKNWWEITLTPLSWVWRTTLK